MRRTTKNLVYELLKQHEDAYVSGADIAAHLKVSRNSVWKAINALRNEGYQIDSATKRGYCLISSPDTFDAASIAAHITDSRIIIDFHDNVSSTNTQAKLLADDGAPEGTLVVANSQSAGRGRQERSFESPKDTGIYFSLILRPSFELGDISLITSYAAVCLAKAIEELTPKHVQIKWVNDVFVDGKKISGILSEASFDAESQSITYVIVGIGVNIVKPESGLDDAIIGTLLPHAEKLNELRSKIVAATINYFMQDYENIPLMPHLEAYRSRSILDGKRVHVTVGQESFDALVCGINDDFTLRVKLDSGEERNLASGEVHIPSSQLSK